MEVEVGGEAMALSSRVSSYRVHGFEVMGSGVDVRRSSLRGMEKSVSLAVNGWSLERRMRALQLGVGGFGRGNRVVVAASPPTEDAAVMTEPLTKEDLVGYLASGCKAKEKWRFVLESLFCFDFPCGYCLTV